MKEKKYYIYILVNRKYGTLYVGVTNSLIRRVSEHKAKDIKGFTKRHNVDQLMYYEIYGNAGQALHREKQLKKWHRSWKIALIEKENHNWDDLYYLLIKH